ncbi:MAG: ABC transporter permease [Clostridiales bacterium]|nr:ABC transporter permease [Clostridiales bacterium]
MNKEIKDIKHKGRIYQTGIYLGKFFRMFIFQNDWKVMPIAALIAGLVALVMKNGLFTTMEGTLLGSFAIACICVWNGFFNSIQNVCRERAIVKREHRSGLHISSYITAHTIYQAFMCLMQTIITLFVLAKMGVNFPQEPKGLVTGNIMLDLGITIFLTTFAADMMSLLVSSFVRNTTTAMTVMPFLLIFQLVFSGGFFSLPDSITFLTDYTITKWGLTATCAQGQYNDLPMTALWKSMKKMRNGSITAGQLKTFMLSSPDFSEDPEMVILLNSIPDDKEIQFDEFITAIESQSGGYYIEKKSGEFNQEEKYASEPAVIIQCWQMLAIQILIYVGVATAALEFIDKDKR